MQNQPAQSPAPPVSPPPHSPISSLKPVDSPSDSEKKKPKKFIFATLLIFAIALGATGGVFGYQYVQKQKLFQTQPSPTPVVQQPSPSPDPTASWETYTNTAFGFLFKYPSEFVLEERDEGFYVIALEKDKSIPQAGIFIDARLNEIYSTFDGAVQKSKENLTDINVEELTNGVKISGTVGPGFGEGLSIVKAVLRYKDGALIVETFNKDPYIDDFNQILSTFKFTTSQSSGDSLDIDLIKQACIELQGTTKVWDEEHLECIEGGVVKEKLIDFCKTYKGEFFDNADSCRYAEEGASCGPVATYYCSFN